MSSHGFLFFLWVLGSYRFLWVFIGSYGFFRLLLCLMVGYGFLWFLECSYGIVEVLISSLVFLLVLMGSYVLLQVRMRCCEF